MNVETCRWLPLLMSMGLGRSTLPMKMYSYRLEALPDGRWRWTVFGEDRKALRRGNAKDEHEAKLAVLRAIDALKIQARKPSF